MRNGALDRNQIDGPEGLFYSNKETLESKGFESMETPVDTIDFDNRIVHATGKDGTKYAQPYDRLILATGSLPIAPAMEALPSRMSSM